MSGLESETGTEQDTETSIQASNALGLDLSVASNSGDTEAVPVPVVMKVDPDSPGNDVNSEATIPEFSGNCETLCVKPEPSAEEDSNTAAVKTEPICDSQECASDGVADGNQLEKSTCGTQTTATESNSLTSTNSQHRSGGSIFSTPQMTTASSSSSTFVNSQHCFGEPVFSLVTTSAPSSFTFANQHHSTRPVFSRPQMTTAASNSFTFRTTQHCFGRPIFSTPPQMTTAISSSATFGNNQQCFRQSNFSMPHMTTTESNHFGTSQTATTGHSGFIFSLPLSADALWTKLLCGNYNRHRVPENPFRRSSRSIPVQNPPTVGKSQTATTVPYCSFSFCSGPRCGYDHHLSHSSVGFPFGSAPQMQHSKTASSSDQPLSTPAHDAAVTTATAVSSCLNDSLYNMQQRMFSSSQLPVSSSAFERSCTSEAGSIPQTKLCFGVPGMILPNTATRTDNHQQSTSTATTDLPSSSKTTSANGGRCPKPYWTSRRKRKNQCENRGPVKQRRILPNRNIIRNNIRNNSEERYFHRSATAISHAPGEDRSSRSEKPLNLTASDLKVVIIPIDYPDVRLSEDNYTELQQALIEEMFVSEDKLLPQFSTCGFEGGALVLKCKTDSAKDWLISVLPNLKSWKGTKLKVGDYKDYLYSTRVTLTTPSVMTTKCPYSVLRLIKKQNEDLDTDQWKIVSSTEQDRGLLLHLSLDPAAIRDLKKRGCHIFLGLEQVQTLQQADLLTSA